MINFLISIDKDLKQKSNRVLTGNNKGQISTNVNNEVDIYHNNHVYNRLYNDNKRKHENLEFKTFIHKEDTEMQSKPKINK